MDFELDLARDTLARLRFGLDLVTGHYRTAANADPGSPDWASLGVTDRRCDRHADIFGRPQACCGQEG